jgi:hypothetical protein
MIWRAFGSSMLAFLASGALVTASAVPAAAGFTVSTQGKTTTVTQTDPSTLYVSRTASGDLQVSDGGPVAVYPPAKNLVVRGASSGARSFLTLVLDSRLPGSLTLDLPGANEVTVRGGQATVAGTLKVRGGDAPHVIQLGVAGAPVTIEGNAIITLGSGLDRLSFDAAGTVLGALTLKGVNSLVAPSLQVGGNLLLNAKREDHPLLIRSGDLIVGKSFTVMTGAGDDILQIDGGSVGRHATIELGGGTGMQVINLLFDSIVGKVRTRMGHSAASSFILGIPTVVEGSLDMRSEADLNEVLLLGKVEGIAVEYAGGAGIDRVILGVGAPQATVALDLGAGDDQLTLDARSLQMLRLDVEFGDGTDVFNQGGYVLPSGSQITNLP